MKTLRVNAVKLLAVLSVVALVVLALIGFGQKQAEHEVVSLGTRDMLADGVTLDDEPVNGRKNTPAHPENALTLAPAPQPVPNDEPAEIDLDTSKVAVFAQSVVEGDERSPPIVRSDESAVPSKAELADEAEYLEFQRRERYKVYSSYLKASGPKLEKLRKLVALGEAQGLPEEQLEEGRSKIRAIEKMVETLYQDYPTLLPEQ